MSKEGSEKDTTNNLGKTSFPSVESEENLRPNYKRKGQKKQQWEVRRGRVLRKWADRHEEEVEEWTHLRQVLGGMKRAAVERRC